MSGYVYFLRPMGADGPIKIGFSKSPYDRIRSLEVHSPQKLVLIIAIKSTQEFEHRLHATFSKSWTCHGEWFDPSADLVALIEKLRCGESLENIVEETDAPNPCRDRSYTASALERRSYMRRLTNHEARLGETIQSPETVRWLKRDERGSRGRALPDAVKAEIDAFVAIPVSKKRRAS